MAVNDLVYVIDGPSLRQLRRRGREGFRLTAHADERGLKCPGESIEARRWRLANGIRSQTAVASIQRRRLCASLRIRSIARTIVVLAAALGFARADAETPKQTAAFGVALDATPQSVATLLAAQYKPCSVARSVYRDRPGAARQTAALAINAGLAANDPASLGLCTHSPEGEGVVDAIDAHFVHPEIDRDQPLYSLEAFRAYPDVVHAERPRLRFSFDELRGELFRTYGKPIDQRRERIASSAANRAKSLGIGRKVNREDYVIRYLWAREGRLADVEHEDAACECDGRYVKAVIEISRSPSTIPANKFYVLSVRLLLEDPDLRRRQAAWNAQSRQQKR